MKKPEPKMRTQEEVAKLYEDAKKVEMTPVLEMLVYLSALLGAADTALGAYAVSRDSEKRIDVEALKDHIEHAARALSRERRKLPMPVQIRLDEEGDRSCYYEIGEMSPVRN